MRVPVHKAVVQAAAGRLVHPNLQGIAFLREAGHIPLAHGEDPQGGIGLGYLHPVQENIGRIAQTLEAEDVAAFPGFEAGGIDPGAVIAAFVRIKIPELFQQISPQGAGFVQGAGHGGGYRHVVDDIAAFLLQGPLGKGLRTGLGGAGKCTEAGEKDGYWFHGLEFGYKSRIPSGI